MAVSFRAVVFSFALATCQALAIDSFLKTRRAIIGSMQPDNCLSGYRFEEHVACIDAMLHRNLARDDTELMQLLFAEAHFLEQRRCQPRITNFRRAFRLFWADSLPFQAHHVGKCPQISQLLLRMFLRKP